MFHGIVDLNGYKGPTLECERPKSFYNDKVFVEYIEGQVNRVCGPYLEKELDAKVASLGSKRRLS